MSGDLESDVKQGNEVEDLRRLAELGYRQELARRLNRFSNFALSFSIICILAGGVTSFHLGLCSVGGAAIGLGWPLAALFALIGCALDGAACIGVSDGRWSISLGGAPGRAGMGLDHGMVQPCRVDHGACGN